MYPCEVNCLLLDVIFPHITYYFNFLFKYLFPFNFSGNKKCANPGGAGAINKFRRFNQMEEIAQGSEVAAPAYNQE